MKNYIFPAVSFVLIFVLYLLTAAPGLMFTDSGELAAVCSTLGIAHPTGYPLFSIIGHLWTLLPLPFEDIYKLNIFAAIVTAASVPLFYSTTLLILKNINEKRPAESVPKRKSKKPEKTVKLLPDLPENISRIIALAAALTFGTAATIWQQGTSIEVYSLHILIMNITVYFAVKGSLTGNLKFFLTAAFFAGLGFTNHMTTLLILPGLFILFFRFYGEKFDFSSARFRNFLILVIPFFIALSVYIYMPLRSAQLPDMNWGWGSSRVRQISLPRAGQAVPGLDVFRNGSNSGKSWEIFRAAALPIRCYRPGSGITRNLPAFPDVAALFLVSPNHCNCLRGLFGELLDS
jgi:hypothetical protein